MLIIQSNRGGLPDHGVERKAGHGGNGYALGARLGVEDLGRDDPGERTARGAEGEVVQPRHGDEAPRRRTVTAVTSTGRKLGEQHSGDDECHHVAQVAADQRPAAAGMVDQQYAQELGNQGDDGRDGLVLERLVAGDADLAVDGHGEVLDGAHARHLDRGLDGARQEQAAEGRAVSEQLHIRLGLRLVLHGDLLLDLLEFGPHPRVLGVPVGVQLRQRAETVIDSAVVDQPPRRLGEEEDEGGEDDAGDVLDAQAYAPLAAVGGREADVGSVRDPRRRQRADAQHELLQRRDATADAGVAQLGLVQRHDHGEEADAHAGQAPACVEVVDGLRACLQPAAETEDEGADEDGLVAAKAVGRESGEEGSEKGSAREDGDYSAAGDDAGSAFSFSPLSGKRGGGLTSH